MEIGSCNQQSVLSGGERRVQLEFALQLLEIHRVFRGLDGLQVGSGGYGAVARKGDYARARLQ